MKKKTINHHNPCTAVHRSHYSSGMKEYIGAEAEKKIRIKKPLSGRDEL